MALIELVDVGYAFPGGWTLFEGVTFRVPDGHHAALVGANGIGKSTLLRLIAGLEPPMTGVMNVPGRVGLMRQLVGTDAQPPTVREFLLGYAPRDVARAGATVTEAERALQRDASERAQLAYANALAAREDAGGYRAEVVWDASTIEAFGQGYP